MRKHRHQRATSRTHAVACAALALFVAACNHASPSEPDPPSGGRTFVLSYSAFTADVEPVLQGQGCDNLNCHGGGIRGTFQLSPPDDKDTKFDFDQACMQVTPSDPANSPLAMKPLAEECGGAAHGGGAFFFSLEDTNYVAILHWVESGVFR